jgi:hypothetical protein
MTIRNERGDELIHHGGPDDGQPLNVLAPPGPHDDEYEVRTEDGTILGAWWIGGPKAMSDETPEVKDFVPPEDYARMKELGWIREDGSIDWKKVALTNLPPEHIDGSTEGPER